MSDEPKSLEPVDLNAVKRERQKEPYFEIRRAVYPDCSHAMRGFVLDRDTRKVFCKCGVQCDPFDALLFYAHAEQRLVHHAEAIKEHERKEAEKKSKRPFVREHKGSTAIYRGIDIVGYRVTLECGHSVDWYRGKRRHSPPRRMTCQECWRVAKLAERGVATVGTSNVG